MDGSDRKEIILRHLPLLLSVALIVPVVTTATTWYVPTDATTIQAGIDSAATGDTVLVACGTYFKFEIIMKSGVCLRGETGDPECVVVDAQGQGSVFECDDADSTTLLEGLTIAASGSC